MTRRYADPVLFAERLKLLMDEQNLLQKNLAALTGLGCSTIKQYTSGRRIPENANLNKLASALNVSPLWLVGLSDYRTDREQMQVKLHETLEPFRKKYVDPDMNKISAMKLIQKAISELGYDLTTDLKGGYDGKGVAEWLSAEFTKELINQCDQHLKKRKD